VPAVRALGISAAGKFGHGLLKRTTDGQGKLSIRGGSEGDEATARRGCG
jgi:hypothetical protein